MDRGSQDSGAGLGLPLGDRTQVSSQLTQLGRYGPGMRRRSGEEWAETVLRRTGVAVLGVRGLAGRGGARPHPVSRPIFAMSQLQDAWRLDRSAGGEIHLDGGPVPDGRWHTAALVCSAAFGRGSPLPQPTGAFTLVLGDRPVLRFAPRGLGLQRWRGNGCELVWVRQRIDVAPPGGALTLDAAIDDESRGEDGYVVLLVDRGLVAEGGIHPRVHADRGGSHEWIRLATGRAPFVSDDHLAVLAAAIAPDEPPTWADQRLVRADLHNHSGESRMMARLGSAHGANAPCGEGTRESLFRYARDVAGLDVFCLSEHDWQMDSDDWSHLTGLSDTFDEPGRFVAMHGYEWTSATFGHRNVYFRDQPGPLMWSQDPRRPQNSIGDDAPTPTQLWEGLRAATVEAITVPHHMSSAFFPLSLEAFHDPDMDRVAEIYSTWGDSLEHDPALTTGNARVAALAFRRAIAQGARVGFIASSDSHDGHPGNAQGTARRPHLFHFLGSGITGVWADELTRTGVFDALRARRTFALTGGDAVLEVEIAEAPMGAEIPISRAGSRPRLRIRADASAGVASIIVYRDAVPAAVFDAPSGDGLEWRDDQRVEAAPRSYFVKATMTDGEVAWSSPIWVDPRPS